MSMCRYHWLSENTSVIFLLFTYERSSFFVSKVLQNFLNFRYTFESNHCSPDIVRALPAHNLPTSNVNCRKKTSSASYLSHQYLTIMCPRPMSSTHLSNQPHAGRPPVTPTTPDTTPTLLPPAIDLKFMPKTAPIMIRRPATPVKRSGSWAIGPPRSVGSVDAASRVRHMRQGSYTVVPLNDYCPRRCNHCGLNFIPRGSGGDFCGGECRYSFAAFRHMEKRQQSGK